MLFRSDPEEAYTPLRWMRYTLTGDPLKPRERRKMEMYKRMWGDINDVPHGASAVPVMERWEYYGKLERKYGLR